MRRVHKNRLITAVIGLSMLTGCQNSDQRAEEREKFGIELFEQGDYGKAKLEFASALKGDGTLAKTYYYLALINEKEGNFLAMKENLKNTIRFDLDNIEARNKLGKVHLLFNDLDAALVEADEMLKRSKESIAASALKAAVFVKQNRQKDALVIIDTILQKQPDYIEVISLKAAIFMQNEKYEQAISLINSVIESGTKDISVYLLKIQLDAKLQNNEAVIASYKRLTEIYPEKHEFKLTLAKIYSQADRNQEAEDLLRAVDEAMPNEILPKLELLNFLQGIGKDRVIEQIHKYDAENENNPELIFLISQWLNEKQYFSEALDLLGKIDRSSGSSELKQRAKLQLATMTFHGGEVEKSKKIVEELLATNLENLEANVLKSKIYIVQEQYAEAVTTLKKVLWANPNSDEALVLLAQVEMIKGFPEKADKKFREALVVNPANMNALNSVISRSLGKNNVDYASGLLTKAIDMQPNNLSLLKQSAEIKMLNRDWDGAKEILKSVERQPEGMLIAKYLNGRIYQEQGDCLNAVSVFKELLRISPAYPDVLRQMATCYEVMQKRSEMIGYVSSFMQRNPNNIVSHLVMGQLFLLENDYEKAISTYNQALNINKKLPQIYAAMANVYSKQNKPQEAIEIYKRGLEENPNNVRLSIYLASVYENINEYQNAMQLYDSLLAVEPRLEIAINNYASLLVDAFGDGASIEKARELVGRFKHSENPFYLDSYAWVELKAGNITDAVLVFEKVNIMAERAVFKYHLGVAYAEQGNNAGAVANLSQAVDLGKQNGEFAEIKQAQQLIKKLSVVNN